MERDESSHTPKTLIQLPNTSTTAEKVAQALNFAEAVHCLLRHEDLDSPFLRNAAATIAAPARPDWD